MDSIIFRHLQVKMNGKKLPRRMNKDGTFHTVLAHWMESTSASRHHSLLVATTIITRGSLVS